MALQLCFVVIGFGFAILTSLGAIIASKYIVVIFFGHEFLESVHLIWILVLTIPVIYTSNYFGVQRLIINHSEKYLFRAMILSALCIIPGMTFLSSLYGIYGGAISILLGEILVLIFVYRAWTKL